MCIIDEYVVNSVLGDGAQSSSRPPLPSLVAVGISEPPSYNENPGFFGVPVYALFSELYTKLCVGLSFRDLWAVLGDSQTVWTGDDDQDQLQVFSDLARVNKLGTEVLI